MPGPYQITTAATLPHSILTPGPFAEGSGIAVVLHDTTNNHVEVWKSTDAGATWAEADSSNHKAVHATLKVIDTFRVGTTLYISYVPNGGTTISVTTFSIAGDPSTWAWGSTIAGGPTPTTTATPIAAFKTLVLSNGDYLTLFTDLNGSSLRRVGYQLYSSGAWGSTVYVFEPGVTEPGSGNYYLHQAVVSSNDTIFMCTGTNLEYLRWRTLSSTFVLSAVKRMPGYVEPQNGVGKGPQGAGPGILASVAGVGLAMVGVAISDTSSVNFPASISAEQVAEPDSFRLDAISDVTTLYDGSQGSDCNPGLVALGDSVFLYWQEMESTGTPSFTPTFKIRRACFKGAGWAGPVDVFAPGSGSGNRIDYICVGAIGTGVGIVFRSRVAADAYENPHFYLDAAVTCSATSIGGAQSGNINAARAS